jgi:hypothetical protein
VQGALQVSVVVIPRVRRAVKLVERANFSDAVENEVDDAEGGRAAGALAAVP